MQHEICPDCEWVSTCKRRNCCIPMEPIPRATETLGLVGWLYFIAAIALVCLVVGLPLYFGSRA